MEFLTINQGAKRNNVPSTRLRVWLAEGRLPGFYSGTRFYLDQAEFERRLSGGYYSAPAEKKTQKAI